MSLSLSSVYKPLAASSGRQFYDGLAYSLETTSTCSHFKTKLLR
nr:MAG TPA: hypothetical protein [Caudoviricetes sp.]